MVLIKLKINRYRCPDCNYVFPDEFTFYEKNEHISKRLKQEFVKRCINKETFRYIANDYSVDGKTVAKAFNDYADLHRDELTYTYTPVILGIDEAHIDDNYRLVLTDILKGRLLDIQKNNHKATVNAYLRTLDKKIIKCATMDFATGYAYCVMKILPDVVIVIDKYHVVQEINRCVDAVRKNLQNYYRGQGYDIRVFKQSRTLFMANWENLTPQGVNKLNQWFNDYPALYEAYMVKETFRDIYATAKSLQEASKMFDAWLSAIPEYEEFRAMKGTFTDRKEHIINYWRYHWTNAFTESTNNLIKNIEKNGRGYKFSVLRDRCLLSINRPKPDKFKFKNAVYVKKVQDVIIKKKQETLYSIAFNVDETVSDLKLFEGKDYDPSFENLSQSKMIEYLQKVGRASRTSS